MTEKLIKNRAFQSIMGEPAVKLEEKIPALIDKAMSLLSQKGRAANLYKIRSEFYQIEASGIVHYWKGSYPNGDPVTDWKQMSKDEFLSWVNAQPSFVREQVHQNLQTYIKTPTPKEQGVEEFPQPRYPMGY